jgi:c-di-GMP-related signal transduction protein
MNPAQTIILQLMQMVQNNEDVPKLEAVLKRDPALIYKLLRFINSAGFGAGREIESLRQAIAMLGYAPLYRWLVLLLATASSSGYSPVLMETAVVRARLCELLGQKFLPRAEGEYLFVAGMFSLLDRLLGLPMKEVLDTIQLPDEVVRALADARRGVRALPGAGRGLRAEFEPGGVDGGRALDISPLLDRQQGAL